MLANLKNKAEVEFKSKSSRGEKIQIVRQWKVEERYTIEIKKETAFNMVVAVSDKSEGFLQWLFDNK